MKLNGIIAGGLITFLLWKILTLYTETWNFLTGFPCSIVGGYVAGRIKSGVNSGAASGLAAGIMLLFYTGLSYGDWERSITAGVIMTIIWIIGGATGDLLAIMGKK